MVAIQVSRPVASEWAPAALPSPTRRDPSVRPRWATPEPSVPPADRRPRAPRVRGVDRPVSDRAATFRRRRLVALVVAVALTVGLAVAVQAIAEAASTVEPSAPEPLDSEAAGPPRPVDGGVYIVQPGDTLWSIAAELAPESDPRPVVDALRAANGGPELQVGARLTLDTG
jgi:nucleoid-associated protein YgaU